MNGTLLPTLHLTHSIFQKELLLRNLKLLFIWEGFFP